jgi:hypothetical protein
MFNEDLENENTLRWMLWKIDPAAYSKHHTDALLKNLHSAPKKEEEATQ